MAITKANLISTLNKGWGEDEAASSTKFDEAIKMALADLSKLPILRGKETTQDLAVGGSEINFPSDMMPGGMIAITLKDASNNEYKPLVAFEGGLREYRACLDNDASTSRPEYFIEADTTKWYVWPTANAAFHVTIEYFKTHPDDPDTILFPESCRNALKAGAILWEAVLRRNEPYQATWGPIYAREFEQLQGMYPGEVRGVYP